MAAKTDGETNGCTFQWKIQNISHCWLKPLEVIQSPTFIADALEATKWSLLLRPVGYNKNNVELCLIREKNCSGPIEVEANYTLAFLHKDGSVLKEGVSNFNYHKDCLSLVLGEERRNVFVTNREAFLPDDTLTVQCTIWKRDEPPVTPTELFARTVWKVKRRSFVWKIDKFSTLKPGVRNKFNDGLMDFDLTLKEGLHSEDTLVIDVILFDKSIKYFSFKIGVINSEGKKKYFGRHEYFETDLKTEILSTLLSTGMLRENKRRYLPNDILSLDVECLYSNGTIADQFCSYGIISPNVTRVNANEIKEHFAKQPSNQLIPVLLNDLKSMYIDGICSDMGLRTSTKTFPAHKCILSARSPVFRRMFSDDMKENNCGHVDITDLEDDTLHRMLLYIYTDSLEDLQLENACKLYMAAVKYEIMSLRIRCSSFLKDNLCPNKACDILILADQHQDDDLRSAAQDLIQRHDEVFGLEVWEHLWVVNRQLAAGASMHRRIYPS